MLSKSAVVGSLLLACLAACESRPRASDHAGPRALAGTTAPAPTHRAPVQTNTMALLAKEHPPGTDVVLDVVVLRDPVVRIQEGGRERHFVLAIATDSTFFKRARDLQKELDSFFEHYLPQADKAIASQLGTTAIVGECERLIRAAQNMVPDAKDLIAIELAGSLSGVEWQALTPNVSRSPKPAQVPWLTEGGRTWSPDSYMSGSLPSSGVTLEGATQQITQLLKASPPRVTELLPNITWMFVDHSNGAEVRAYNKLVGLMNKEIRRRRSYGMQLVETGLKLIRGQLDGLSGAGPFSLSARVIAGDDWEAFHNTLGMAPSVFLREQAGPNTLADHVQQGRRLLVTSSPDGASVRLDGKALGTTPLLTDVQPTGATPTLALTRKGYTSFEAPIAVAPSPLVVQTIDATLEPATR